MDELADKLNEILGNPQQLEQIRKMAAMMGLGAEENSPSQPLSSPNPTPQTVSASPDLSIFMKIAPLLNLVKNDDETLTFLMALRPMLGEARQKKLDEAVRILRVFRLFPLLKNAGILF